MLFLLLLLLLLWSTRHCKQRRLSFLTWLSFREYQLPRRGAHWLFSLRDLVSRAHKSLPELTSKHLLSFLESFFFLLKIRIKYIHLFFSDISLLLHELLKTVTMLFITAGFCTLHYHLFGLDTWIHFYAF